MKYSKSTYIKALAALATLRETISEKEQHTVDFVAEAIAEKADRDTGPSTNADRIRGMDDEELACLLDSFRCGNCMKRGNNCFPGSPEDWLRQPAEIQSD